MKNERIQTHQRAFHGTSGNDRRHLRCSHTGCRAFCVRRSTGPYIRGSDHSSGIYPCRSARSVLRLSDQQHSRRMYPSRYYLWKPCDTDRSGIYADAEKQEQISRSPSPDHREYADCTIRAKIRLHGSSFNPVHDADSRCR